MILYPCFFASFVLLISKTCQCVHFWITRNRFKTQITSKVCYLSIYIKYHWLPQRWSLYHKYMVLLSPSVNGLRNLLHMCEAYADQHGLKYNEQKSELMVFIDKNKRPTNVPDVYFNNVQLNRVDQFKYLGLVVTDTLSDDQDIEREWRALSVRGNMLAHRFACCTLDVKLTPFCQSFYTSGLWGKKTWSVVQSMRGGRKSILEILSVRLDSAVLGQFTDLHLRDVGR